MIFTDSFTNASIDVSAGLGGSGGSPGASGGYAGSNGSAGSQGWKVLLPFSTFFAFE
jgi:hypothetical protein